MAATISAAVSFCVVEEKLDEINIGEAAGRVLKQVAASSSIPKPYEGRSEGVLPPAKKSKTTTSSKMAGYSDGRMSSSFTSTGAPSTLFFSHPHSPDHLLSSPHSSSSPASESNM